MIAQIYPYGEIMLHQKRVWNGPVYSEGRNHYYYSGLTDGNYALSVWEDDDVNGATATQVPQLKTIGNQALAGPGTGVGRLHRGAGRRYAGFRQV